MFGKKLFISLLSNPANANCVKNSPDPFIRVLFSDTFQTRSVRQQILHKDVISTSKKQQAQGVQCDSVVSDDGRTSVVSKIVPDYAEDLPVSHMKNPYARPYRKCIVCEHNIELDYKNIRFLSQFVSPYTGMIYGRQYTGLCQYMQRRVSKLIKRARYFGFMPYRNKDPNFLHDPKLFDPFASRRLR